MTRGRQVQVALLVIIAALATVAGCDRHSRVITARRPITTAPVAALNPPRREIPVPTAPNAEVDRWERSLERDPAIIRALSRLGLYRDLFDEALRRASVPMDFAYLPLIESEYLPSATSRAGAAGMWQLMPSTARAYGLEVSPWVDERRDPIRSTGAAARHLHDLYVELGSWQLAAAAYNCGARRVAASAQGSRTNSAYWRGRGNLPAETRAYVPKLVAAIRIARRMEARAVRTPLRFREVIVPGGVSLADVARDHHVPADQTEALNPHLIRRSTPPGRAWPVRIPLLP